MSWSEIPSTVKTTIGLIVVLIIAGALLRDFIGLPQTVKENVQRIESLESGVNRIEDKVDLGNCLQLAEKRGSRWEECLNTR